MSRMSEQERRELVDGLVLRLGAADEAELAQLRKQMNQRMAKGQSPTGDLEADFRVLAFLRTRIATLQRQEEHRIRTPEEVREAEAERLSRSNGVALSIARNYLERKAAKERSAFDVTRSEIRQAPEPEAPPTPFDERAAIHAHYNNKNKED